MTGSSGDPPDFSDRLADLLLYAPLGLLWERDQVLERLVKRGRSQTQLAKLAAQMAAQRGPEQVEAQVSQALEALARAAAGPLSRVLIEAGVALGIPGAVRPPPATEAPATQPDEPPSAPCGPDGDVGPGVGVDPAVGVTDYETLTARDLLARLPALEAATLVALRERELAGRARKTVLTRIDQLLEGS